MGIRGLWLALKRLLLEPRSVLEDDRRKEFILNVILSSSLLLLVIFDLCILFDSLSENDYHGMSLLVFTIPVAALAGLLALSRAGYFRWSAYAVLAIFFAVIFYSARTWGIDLPAVLLGYALVVSAASILVGTRFGAVVACTGIFVLVYFGYQEIQGAVLTDHYWKFKALRIDNVIEYSAMLFYLALISGLSSSEIDKSLRRARISEVELKRERDSLEITVDERTRELRHSQAERLLAQSQFVELGQLAGGYVHDLVNPLTVLSLSMDRLKAEGFGQASEALTSALGAGKRMESLLAALRKQIRSDSSLEKFFLNQELGDAVRLLGYTARSAGVELKLNLPERDLEFYGSACRFHQIASNLITNAIESYGAKVAGVEVPWKVAIGLSLNNGLIKLTVADRGSGILASDLNRIFQPLFSSKHGRGLGIGLSTVKVIVEKDFGGSIAVFSQPGQGSRFVVTFPMRETG